MKSGVLLYGSTGFVGCEIANLAVERGLQPIIAGRDAAKIQSQAAKLGVECRLFSLDDAAAMDKALREVVVVLNCAGPYIYTSRPMVEACLRTGTHYLDLTGEIPVLEALAARDGEAKARGVMLLPAVGFDVVPTDCLAIHLKQRLPSATRLALAFYSQGSASFPPGSVKTMMETIIPYGFKVRRDGQLVPFPRELKTRLIDFGSGPVEAILFPWGDVFTAFYSTRIPNIEDYAVIKAKERGQLATANRLGPLFKLGFVRRFFTSKVPAGSTAEQRANNPVSVWGEVANEEGRTAVSRLHGPEGGVIWTSLAALAAVKHVLAGNILPGFQTPALAYGADFVLECEGVRREDL